MENRNRSREPKILVKPLGRYGGLDNIHLSLIVLVAILVTLLLVISYYKPPIMPSTQNNNCTYAYNGLCSEPIHNASMISKIAAQELASYNYVNTSLSLIPYISDVNNESISYMPKESDWYVNVPMKNPGSNTIVNFGMLINDKNVSDIVPFLQTVRPQTTPNQYVVSKGVVKLGGKVSCNQSGPLQVYWFIDPYANGNIRSLFNAVNISSEYGKNVSVSTYILSTQSTQAMISTYGIGALNLGKYVYCASRQENYADFVKALNISYVGTYIPQSTLQDIANSSGLNMSQLNSCIASSQTVINRQAVLASYYNITSTPTVVTDCQYLSIPQTESEALCYADKRFC